MTVSRLTEDDFSTTVSDLGEYIEIPVIELSEGDYVVAYGHIEKEEFLGHCNQYYRLACDNEFSLADDEEVLWTYAKRKVGPGSEYEGEWEITWRNVQPDDEDAFPITLVNTW